MLNETALFDLWRQILNKLNFVAAILSFLKVGIMGFGGGAALIPVIEDEVVQKKKWMTKDDFDYKVVVASISPGSLPVSFLSMWNHKYSIVSSFAYALPGPILFLILQTGFALIGEAGVRYIGFASVGIIAFILMVIYSFIKRNWLHDTKIIPMWQYCGIIVTAFFLTSGNSVRRLAVALFGLRAGVLPAPVFAIAMLQLLIILFFIVFFVGQSKSLIKLSTSVVISLFFAISAGRSELLSNWNTWLIILMLVLAAGSVSYDAMLSKDKNMVSAKKFDLIAIRNFVLFGLIGIVLTFAVFAISGDSRTFGFAIRVILSSWQSFGGGEVYINIADAVFVQGGFVSEEIYYSQIVGVSSAMPGPVLMAIAGGIGFWFGNSIGGYFLAWIFGLLAVFLAVVASALGTLALFTGFGLFKDSYRLKMIVRYMIPVICGVLINVALTLLNQTSAVIINQYVNPWMSVGIVIGIFLVMLFLRTRYKVSDIKLLLGGGIGTLLVFGLVF